MGIFWSLKKSRQLKRINQLLELRLESFSIEYVLSRGDKLKQAKQILYDTVEKDSLCAEIMARHGANRETLDEAFAALSDGGANVTAKGHYVAASALAFGATLDYTLTHYQNVEPGARQEMAYRLIDYFDSGELGLVK